MPPCAPAAVWCRNGGIPDASPFHSFAHDDAETMPVSRLPLLPLPGQPIRKCAHSARQRSSGGMPRATPLALFAAIDAAQRRQVEFLQPRRLQPQRLPACVSNARPSPACWMRPQGSTHPTAAQSVIAPPSQPQAAGRHSQQEPGRQDRQDRQDRQEPDRVPATARSSARHAAIRSSLKIGTVATAPQNCRLLCLNVFFFIFTYIECTHVNFRMYSCNFAKQYKNKIKNNCVNY
jgi:hypothetical protein